MRLNPNSRKYIQQEAKEKIAKKVLKIQKKYKLTDLEVIRILSSMQAHMVYWKMREDIELKGLNK